jgi:hypothetical protein
MTIDMPDLAGLGAAGVDCGAGEWVKTVVGPQVPAARSVPPRSVFRANAAGRRAWLAYRI